MYYLAVAFVRYRFQLLEDYLQFHIPQFIGNCCDIQGFVMSRILGKKSKLKIKGSLDIKFCKTNS